DQVLAAREVVDAIHVDERLRDYIVELVRTTRRPSAAGLPLDHLVRYGASPRATIALTLASRGWAFLNGRAYVTPQDVKTLALDVLRHRVAVTYEAEARETSAEDVVRKVLETVPVP